MQPAADFRICPSCGTEFGYHDAGRGYDELRSLWLQGGAVWWSRNRPEPPFWNGIAQLLSAGYIAVFSEAASLSQSRIQSLVRLDEIPQQELEVSQEMAKAS